MGSLVQRQCRRAEWIKVHQRVSNIFFFGCKQEAEVLCHPQIFAERACFYSSFYLFVSSPHWEPECLQLMESRGGAGC